MLIPSNLKIYLATQAVDMRKSYQTLSVLVKNVLSQSPFCGHLFVFYNKKKDLIKVLYWHRNGFCLWQKKLEKGRYVLPTSFSGVSLEISWHHLEAFIQGLDCWGIEAGQELTFEYVT